MEIEVTKDLPAYKQGKHEVSEERGAYLIAVGAATEAKGQKKEVEKKETKKAKK